MKKNYSRSRYLINREIQLKYMLLTMALLFLYTLFLLGAIFGPSILVLLTESPIQLKAEISQVLLVLHNHIWPGIGVVIVLFGLYSIMVTHKIVGPLFVIDKTIREIAEGDLSVRAHIRKNDDLQEFRSNFNRMAGNMERLLINLDREYHHLSSYVSELENQLTSKDGCTAEFLEDLAGKMSVDKNNIGSLLEKYKYRKDK